jgi:8-oxo-dGTP pyrophosphatase MutT (NUDIX family)
MEAMNEVADSSLPRGSVAVIVRDGRLLLIRRSRHVVAPRMYCFPGGAIEAGETEEQALEREIREELGTQIEPVRRLWQSATPRAALLSWWLCRLDDAATLVPNPAEVESVHWVTLEEMATLPDSLESNQQFLDALAAGEFDLDLV